MDHDDWFEAIRRHNISLQFAQQIALHFGEYPGMNIVEALWYSDWGRGVARRLRIRHFRIPEPLRMRLQQRNHFASGSDSDSE